MIAMSASSATRTLPLRRWRFGLLQENLAAMDCKALPRRGGV